MGPLVRNSALPRRPPADSMAAKLPQKPPKSWLCCTTDPPEHYFAATVWMLVPGPSILHVDEFQDRVRVGFVRRMRGLNYIGV